MSFFQTYKDKTYKKPELNVKNYSKDDVLQNAEKIKKYKETIIAFGKYKGEFIYDMIKSEDLDKIKYLEWVYSNENFNKGLKKIIEILFKTYLDEPREIK